MLHVDFLQFWLRRINLDVIDYCASCPVAMPCCLHEAAQCSLYDPIASEHSAVHRAGHIRPLTTEDYVPCCHTDLPCKALMAIPLCPSMTSIWCASVCHCRNFARQSAAVSSAKNSRVIRPSSVVQPNRYRSIIKTWAGNLLFPPYWPSEPIF